MTGRKLLHYEILSKIGSGGMGEVYRARDTKLGREVALKVLPKAMASDPERRSRFEREARTIATLKHPNIVTIHSVEEGDGATFLTMELIEGQSLSELIPNGGLPLSRFFDIAVPLADAIASAHAKGIVHRDLKPQNVMVDAEGRVKVLDFGLAKLWQADPDKDKTIAASASDTEPGLVMGSVSYMSPEQAEGRFVDQRSDIFSLGILFYEMATGERPFKGDSSLSIMSAILRDTPPTVTEIRQALPNQLSRIVQHCLSKDPARRFQSALDLKVELEDLRTEVDSQTGQLRSPSGAYAAMRGGSRSKRVGIGIVAAAVIALAVVFGPNLFKKDGAQVPTAEANSLAVFAFDNLKDPSDPDRMGQIMQELLITDLSGLPSVKVFSSQRLNDIEKQLGETSASDRSAVAKQAGAKSMLTGSLSQLGTKWILTCQVVDVANGTIVQSKRIDGEDLYALVDQLSGEFHKELQLGEPTEIAQKIPIKEKTSASLEAYRHYLAGVDLLDQAQFAEAVGEFRKAVDIDPKFGQAYYKLGVADWWLGSDRGAGSEHFQYLIDHDLFASPREKQMTETMLNLSNQQWAEALPKAEQATRDYPDEKEAWYALGEALFHFPGNARRVESLGAFERAVALDPTFQLPYRHIFDIYVIQKRYDEGIALADQRIADDPTNPFWDRYRAWMITIQGDSAAGETAIAQALSKCKTPADRRELYKLVAQGYGNRADIARFETYVKKAIENDPNGEDPTLPRYLIALYHQLRKYDEAEKLIRTTLAKAPDDQLYEQLLGLYSDRSEYSKARDLAAELVEKNPENPAWYGRWVRYTIFTGKDAGVAIAKSEEKIQERDGRVQLLSAIADAYSDVGDYRQAVAYGEEALAADPENEYPEIYEELANRTCIQGNFEEAERNARQALAYDPKNIGSLMIMAAVNFMHDNRAAADEYLDKAEEAIPVAWLGPFLRAWFYISIGDLDAARTALDEVDQSTIADDAKYRFLTSCPPEVGIGWAYMTTGHLDEAEAVFDKAKGFPVAKRDPHAIEGLGWTYIHRGDYAKATATLSQALKIGYGHSATHMGLAVASLLQGDTGAAERRLKQAESEHPHVNLTRLLGYVYAAEGRYEEARRVAEKAVAMDDGRASHELLAYVLVAGDIDVPGGIEEATTALSRQAIPLMNIFGNLPITVVPEHSLGLAYMKQGDARKAIEYLEMAVERQPSSKAAKDDLKRAQELLAQRP